MGLWWRWQDLNLRPWDYDSPAQNYRAKCYTYENQQCPFYESNFESKDFKTPEN